MKGFTLIEMIVATALASLLAIALLGLIPDLLRTNRLLAADSGPRSAIERTLELIHADLLHARSIQRSDSTHSISLQGPAGLDIAGNPNHAEVTIQYEVRQVAGRWWLLRIQSQERMDSAARARTDLLMEGVRQVGLEPVLPKRSKSITTNSGNREQPQAGAATGPGMSISPPGSVRLSLRFSDEAKPVVERLFVLNPEVAP